MKLPELVKELSALEPLSTSILANVSDEHWETEIIKGKWSMAEQLGHILLSSYRITGVYKQPNAFFENFGPAPKEKRAYDDLLKFYRKKLDAGQKSTPDFIPNKLELLSKEEGLKSWIADCQKLQKRLADGWTEERLDSHLVPHPVLGMLSTRELLIFHIFHTKHHFDQIVGLNKLC